VGLFERLGIKKETRRARAARESELAGELGTAVELYLEAELPDEAARVLLLRADAERAPEKRLAFCASAADVAEDAALQRRAAARKALLSFDLLTARGGSIMKSEIVGVARALEDAGELERAADAYAMAGDDDGEVRVLTAAGAIERLEERLRVSDTAARDLRELDRTLRTMADLDRTAERRAALDAAAAWLAAHDDERVADAARAIRARLVRGPLVRLEVGGVVADYALGNEVTVGRGDATIVASSRAVSRRHVRIRRGEKGAVVEDLGTRNGTILAGAKLVGDIPISSGVELRLGGEVLCTIQPAQAHAPLPLVVDVAAERYVVPLGPMPVGPWHVSHEDGDDGGYCVLSVPPGAPRPVLGGYELATRVELCIGDELRETRSGPVRVRVVAPGGAILRRREGAPSEPERP
jgi:hypothetical protein